jgi:hypothetical protein
LEPPSEEHSRSDYHTIDPVARDDFAAEKNCHQAGQPKKDIVISHSNNDANPSNHDGTFFNVDSNVQRLSNISPPQDNTIHSRGTKKTRPPTPHPKTKRHSVKQLQESSHYTGSSQDSKQFQQGSPPKKRRKRAKELSGSRKIPTNNGEEPGEKRQKQLVPAPSEPPTSTMKNESEEISKETCPSFLANEDASQMLVQSQQSEVDLKEQSLLERFGLAAPSETKKAGTRRPLKQIADKDLFLKPPARKSGSSAWKTTKLAAFDPSSPEKQQAVRVRDTQNMTGASMTNRHPTPPVETKAASSTNVSDNWTAFLAKTTAGPNQVQDSEQFSRERASHRPVSHKSAPGTPRDLPRTATQLKAHEDSIVDDQRKQLLSQPNDVFEEYNQEDARLSILHQPPILEPLEENHDKKRQKKEAKKLKKKLKKEKKKNHKKMKKAKKARRKDDATTALLFSSANVHSPNAMDRNQLENAKEENGLTSIGLDTVTNQSILPLQAPKEQIESIQVLCSEAFLENWAGIVAELSSTRWVSDASQVLERLEIAPKRIILQDTPLVDESGVDLELYGRGAIIIQALSSWNDPKFAPSLQEHLAHLVSLQKYEVIRILVCVDVALDGQKAIEVGQIGISFIGAPSLVEVEMVSQKSLPSIIGIAALEAFPTNESFIVDYDALSQDNKANERVRFLLLLLPSLTVNDAYRMLALGMSRDIEGREHDDPSRTWFRRLLSRDGSLERDHIIMSSHHSEARSVDGRTMAQLSFLLNVFLGKTSEE